MTRYRIVIDRDECTGDGVCVDTAPNTFDLDDENIAIVIDAEGDSPDEILEAAQGCPTDAISLYDTETGEKVWPED